MRPTLYPAGETAFLTEGLGRLTDTVECRVTEELNGAYELALKYDRGGIHAGEIREGTIIFAAHDDAGTAQPFRVYRIGETLDGEIGVLARHISGDLSRIPVLPFTASGAAAALAGLRQNAVVSCPFTFQTDVTAAGAFALEVPTSAKAALGSGDGSVIGTFGGEAEYDGWTVILHEHRGADNGVCIRYGKNLTGLEAVSEAGAYNAVVPFCKTQAGVVMCSPPVVYHGQSYSEAVPLDLSDRFDYVPSAEQLQLEAVKWLNDSQPWIAEKSITVKFVALWQTEEYRDYAPLERVALGDTVRVLFPQGGVDAKFRVVRTVYDPLEERYTEITLGREDQTVSGMVAELVKKLAEARDIAQEIANGTYGGGTFINGSLIYAPRIFGGEISIGENGSGYNFRVDSNGNIKTSGGMEAVGHYTVYINDPETGEDVKVGYYGRATGRDNISETSGVALAAGTVCDPDDLGATDYYVIATDRGVRMQAGDYSLYVTASGSFYKRLGESQDEGKEIATKADTMTTSAVEDLIEEVFEDEEADEEEETEGGEQ